mmetsp:Transcript_3101/g.1816  ORF Transcript_3101/g.1816 Transcript_3101/m.1816 type:complete len:487 (+) Transcript_3101:3990-5450(+)
MTNKILINAVDVEECRIARVIENQLEEFHIETTAKEITKSNIYRGVITSVEPSLQAVFVNYGTKRNGFLKKNEIHKDYFLDNKSEDKCISSLVKKRQELLVQIITDPIMKKGALLTTLISLTSHYLVLMTGSDKLGISRKIEDEKERARLKKIINSLKIAKGLGMIVRTTGINCTKTLLSKDIRNLMRMWKNIKAEGIKKKAPAILYKENSLVLRCIRDSFINDVSEILIDDTNVFNETKAFVRLISPKHTKIVKLYKGQKPIFTKYQLEQQITSIYESRVKLKSGGSIVITPTEALVSIDVNSGKATQKNSVEQTAFQTNIEAAEEIVKQLRLRDLGGLIVIDFIDMKNQNNKTKVEKTIKQNLKKDKAKIKTGKITRFGLMEMSRQRLRPSIEFGSFISCKHCHGKGLIPSTENMALSFLRKLRLETLKGEKNSVKCTLPADVSKYLLNKKRKEILELEERQNILITIEPDKDMMPGETKIIYN